MRRKFFPAGPSCSLWLPFSAYGGEQTRILDISGNGYHGTITGPVPYSPPMLSPLDQVTNGSFTGDTGWTKGTGWAITTVATKTAGTASDLEQDISAVVGDLYRLRYVLTRTAGSLTAQIGGVDGSAKNASATCVEHLRASTTGNLKFQADATFAGTVDNVSVQKITGFGGHGWLFDSDDYIDIGTSFPAFTDATWLVWLRSIQDKATGTESIVDMSKSGDESVRFSINWSNAGQLNVNYAGNILNFGTKAGYTEKNVLCAMTVDSSISKVTAYLDGAQYGSAASITPVSITPTGGFRIGTRYNSTSNAFGGVLYELRMYNRVFTPNDIKSFFESTRYRYGV